MNLTDKIQEPGFETQSLKGKQALIDNLVGFYGVLEGIFFYSGFVVLLSFGRQNRLPGSCEQIQYILRDESIHMNFGLEMINTIVDENPEIWTPDFQASIIDKIKKAVKLECDYAKDLMSHGGVLGLNDALLKEYVQYIADRRLEKLRLPKQYNAENPFPWMSEVIDLKKEKNFFETRVTEYQRGGALEW